MTGADPEQVEMLLQYIYTGTYEQNPSLQLHLDMYKIGLACDAPGLRRVAGTHFQREAKRGVKWFEDPYFPEMVAEAFKIPPFLGYGMRAVVGLLVAERDEEDDMQEWFSPVVDECPDFWEVVEDMKRHPYIFWDGEEAREYPSCM